MGRRARLDPRGRPFETENRPPSRYAVGWIDPACFRAREEEVFVLHVGLDLSRKQVEVCLISDQGELID
jgi:hypothetical protein